MEREKLASRLGFIMLSAGSAIGIGNVWKFPYVTGQAGGGYFVLIYLLFLLLIGIPLVSMEFAVGRGSQKSPLLSFGALEPTKKNWNVWGYACLIGNYLIIMFYTTVTGWMLNYFYKLAAGHMEGLKSEQINQIFTNMIGNSPEQIFWMGLVVIIGISVCYGGLQNSLEKITKWMMMALFVVMIFLAGYGMTMGGAKEGLSFFLTPNFENMQKVGFLKVVVMAMNQAFFTLGIGVGSMAIFGSYIGKEHRLFGESIQICILDTLVALTSGLIIFPLCYTYNVNVGAGPSLVFITLPNVFANMQMGRFWGGLFFLFLSFAALSTIFSVFENIVCMIMETFSISRKKSCILNLFSIFILSVPCALGFNEWNWSWLKVFGGTILNLEDFLLSNIFLPIGALCYLIFCTRDCGWGWNNYFKEVNEGEGLAVKPWMRGYLTYVLPFIIIFIILYGIWEKFFGA